MIFGRGRAAEPVLRSSDLLYVSPLRAAQVVEPAPAAMWAVYLMLAVIVVALTWASLAHVDMVTRAPARVVSAGREQVIASLEGGILRELLVKEGQLVETGQDLAALDATRFEAQQAEGQARRNALRAAIARAQAEATGAALQFPRDLVHADSAMQGETASFNARRQLLADAVDVNRRNLELLQHELGVAQSMSAKGLMSEVEVMRVRRQVNDLEQQTHERVSRFRQEAAAELVRLRNELAMQNEQMVVRDDALRRTVLRSPVRGVVKAIRANTVGGVVAPGAPVMEVVPRDDGVHVEMRIKPSDIGFVRPGQPVLVKLSAFEFTVYGGMHGEIETISPDAIGDTEHGAPEALYYRALVRADAATLRAGNKPLTVLPGMIGTAEIRTGERTVIAFLLRPVLRSREAFQER